MEPSPAPLEEVVRLILYLLSSLFTFRIIYFRLYSVFDDITSDTIWRTNRQKIIHGWKLIITASTLALGTSIALLQLQPVLPHPFLRTIAILACICSAASLANSSALHAFKKRLDCDTIRLRWLDASRYPKKKSSTDFWVCISSPLTFLIWAIVFLVVTIYSLSWVTLDSTSSKADTAIPGIITSVMMVIVLFMSYRVLRFVKS